MKAVVMRWCATLLLVMLVVFARLSSQADMVTMMGTPSGEETVTLASDTVNQYVRAVSAPSLLVTLQIDGGDIRLSRASVNYLPDSRPRNVTGDSISVVSRAGGAQVATFKFGDATHCFVEEGMGYVRADSRVATVSLALTGAVDEIEVSLSSNGARARFPVGGIVEAFCRDAPNEAICRRIN